MNLFEVSLKELMNDKLRKLETEFDADVIFFYGEIHTSIIRPFRDLIEDLKKPDPTKPEQKKLVIILNTPGGSAEAVEKLVDIIRHHYADVSFVVPDFAMSAGTISACQETEFRWTIPRRWGQSILKFGMGNNGFPLVAI